MLHRVRRILVVDDNADTAAMIAEWLKTHGYDARTAYDGASALEMIETFAPDIVLVDLAMPRMNGWEVARRVRRLELAKPPRLIAISALEHAAHQKQSEIVGFEAHLVKPFTLQKFIDLLQSLSD